MRQHSFDVTVTKVFRPVSGWPDSDYCVGHCVVLISVQGILTIKCRAH